MSLFILSSSSFLMSGMSWHLLFQEGHPPSERFSQLSLYYIKKALFIRKSFPSRTYFIVVFLYGLQDCGFSCFFWEGGEACFTQLVLLTTNMIPSIVHCNQLPEGFRTEINLDEIRAKLLLNFQSWELQRCHNNGPLHLPFSTNVEH